MKKDKWRGLRDDILSYVVNKGGEVTKSDMALDLKPRFPEKPDKVYGYIRRAETDGFIQVVRDNGGRGGKVYGPGPAFTHLVAAKAESTSATAEEKKQTTMTPDEKMRVNFGTPGLTAKNIGAYSLLVAGAMHEKAVMDAKITVSPSEDGATEEIIVSVLEQIDKDVEEAMGTAYEKLRVLAKLSTATGREIDPNLPAMRIYAMLNYTYREV